MYLGLNNLGLNGMNPPFSPNYLFINNEAGDWWDASDLPLMYQDSAGTTAAAVNQPVGLMLGQRYKGQRGANLSPGDGTFDSAAGWSLGAGWAVSGGSATMAVAQGANSAIGASNTLTAGKFYEFTADVTRLTGTWQFFAANTGTTVSTTSGRVSATLRADASGGLAFLANTGFTGSIDNFTVREVPGIHRYQTTSANRPTLSARYNVLTKTEQFSDPAWQKISGGTGSAPIVTDNYGVAPDGTQTAARVQLALGAATVAADFSILSQGFSSVSGAYKSVYYIKATFAGEVGKVVGVRGLGPGYTAVALTADWQAVPVNDASSGAATPSPVSLRGGGLIPGCAATADVLIWHPDCRLSIHANGVPTYQRVNTATDYDTAGFPCYLSYNGTNSWMQTSAVDFSGTDKATVVAAITKLSDAARGMLLELGGGASNLFRMEAPVAAASPSFTYNGGGSSLPGSSVSGFPAPVSAVVTGWNDIPADQLAIRVNGVSSVINTADQGAGTFANASIYFGARTGTSLFFNGNEYISAIAGAAKTEALIARMERYAAAKAGLSI